MTKNFIAIRTLLPAFLLVSVLICGVVSTSTADSPYINSAWDDTTRDQSTLLAAAEGAVRSAGFTENFVIAGQSAIGSRGDYVVSIRCVSAKKIVIFTVAGPNASECDRITNVLRKNFR